MQSEGRLGGGWFPREEPTADLGAARPAEHTDAGPAAGPPWAFQRRNSPGKPPPCCNRCLAFWSCWLTPG